MARFWLRRLDSRVIKLSTTRLRLPTHEPGFRNLLGRLEIRFVLVLSVLWCMTAVAIYLTRPPAKLPAMEPVLYAPNAELLRHSSERPHGDCDVDYNTSSCSLWYHTTEN